MDPRTLQLTGATPLLPRMQRAAALYMDLHAGRIGINGGSRTARGCKALRDGTTDIATAGGAAPDDVTAAAVARGGPLCATIVTEDTILPVGYAANSVTRPRLFQLSTAHRPASRARAGQCGRTAAVA